MGVLNVLLACEESQVVTKAFRKRGHKAYSCDISPCYGGHPEWHIQDDVKNIVGDGWELMIAFPPCTHIAVSGAKHFKKKREDGRQQQAIGFFMFLANAPVERIAIENPVGIMSTVWRKPDQIIQPYFFGDPYTKTTCLWLKNLPVLEPTNIVEKGERKVYSSGKSMPKWYADIKDMNLSPEERMRRRSKTFDGIAEAMADQWGDVIDIGIQGTLF